MDTDMWTYRLQPQDTSDLDGFDVEAMDGSIGKVDEATYEVGASYVVVDTGPWIFGKKVLIPAGAIVRVDLENRTAFLRLTKDQIEASPEFDAATYRDAQYRSTIGFYYTQ